MRTFGILLVTILLTGCGQYRKLEPLSVCEQGYVLSELSSVEWSALRQAHELALPQCKKSEFGCSIGIAKFARPGVAITVIVHPVAEVRRNGECIYASDTQTYYSFDAEAKFLNAKRGVG